jgi:rod shape-determining protein MreC
VTSNKTIVLTVLLTVIILLNLPAPASMRIKAGTHNSVAPFQNIASLLTNKIGNILSTIRHPGYNASERKKLLTENAEMRLQLNNMQVIKQENTALRKLIHFKNKSTKKLILCEVIARHGANGWWQTITVNRGKEDGITKGAAVITIDGLIGKINAVSKNTSTIQLITDYSCNISCILPRTKAFGIVKGSGISLAGKIPLEILIPANPLGMDYISKEASIKPHDLVITSGLGRIFPADLIVGHIIKAKLDRSGLYQHATITPAADLSKLHYVFIIKKNQKTQKQQLTDKHPVGDITTEH